MAKRRLAVHRAVGDFPGPVHVHCCAGALLLIVAKGGRPDNVPGRLSRAAGAGRPCGGGTADYVTTCACLRWGGFGAHTPMIISGVTHAPGSSGVPHVPSCFCWVRATCPAPVCSAAGRWHGARALLACVANGRGVPCRLRARGVRSAQPESERGMNPWRAQGPVVASRRIVKIKL